MKTTEFQCPFCFEWSLKENFDEHMKDHSDPVMTCYGVIDKPKTLEEMKNRFTPLGYYNEK
jgi:hypothetical protein